MKRCLGCMQTYNKQLNICPHCGYAENTTPDETIHMVPGTFLHDRFIIGKVVGCGGFGVTYIAWDNLLQHKVAIKEYLPSEFSTRMPGVSQLTIFEGDKTEQFDDGMKKFLDEARRLAKFQNEPGIVKIFDCFEENRTAYIVMEYLQGVTLTHYLEEHGKITEDEAVQMILPILNSLKIVHREGIIHRDIAPDNIMVTDDGQVKLIDFGAARYATTSHSRSLTVIIKQGYSPVEQYQSRGNQGGYTDVYAMGSVLYRMITGCTPPDSMERNAYFENIHKDILEPLHKSVRGISENKENAILNAMNIRIEDRSPDMDTLIKELTTDEPVARINGKIKRKDILQWPLWLKITIPMAMMGVIALLVLFVTGVIGFEFKKPREIAIPDGMTRVPRIVSMNESNAIKELRDKQLNYVVVGTKNDETIDIGCVLSQNPSVGSIVSINHLVEVIVSAGKNMYEVPYMIGLSEENAKDSLEKQGFSYTLYEEYNSVIEKGYVISQSIEGGVETEISTLTLTISKGRNPDIEYNFEDGEIPNLIGLTFDEAISVCEKYGIKLIVNSYEYSTEYSGMCVLQQFEAKVEKVEPDMIIEVVLSKGEQIFKVPLIVYLTEDEAIEKLEDRNLKYELVYEESETVAEGCVASQSVDSGTVIDKDDVIRVVISTGPPKFDMIDVTGMTEARAITALQNLYLVVTVKYEYQSNIQVGTVISQSKVAGESVYKGYSIQLVVCYENLVKVMVKVPDNWTEPYIYAYSENRYLYNKWPGMPLNVDNGFYSIELPNWVKSIYITANDTDRQAGPIHVELTGDVWITINSEDDIIVQNVEDQDTTLKPTLQETIAETTSSQEIYETEELTIWVRSDMREIIEAYATSFLEANNLSSKYKVNVEVNNVVDVNDEHPDIYCFNSDSISRFVYANKLYCLDSVYSNNVKNTNSELHVNNATVGNSIYAFPFSSDGLLMYYDKSVITDPTSLEQIILDCEKSGKNFYYEISNPWYANAFFHATGCKIEYIYGNSNNFISCNMNYNNNAGLIALKEMINLVSSSAYRNDSSVSNCENAAVVISGTWDTIAAQEMFGSNYEAAELPCYVGEDGNSYHLTCYKSSYLLGVNPLSDEVDICLELANYLTSAEVQLALFEYGDYVPTNIEVQKNEIVKANKVVYASIKQDEYGVKQDWYPEDYWVRGMEFFKKILNGNYGKDSTDEYLLSELARYESDCKSYCE